MDFNRNGVRTDAPIMKIDMPGFIETAVPLKPTDIEFSETIYIILAHRQLSLLHLSPAVQPANAPPIGEIDA